jgi:succinate dehydrogenase (ubiquinone) membrane anchor subunit
VCVKLQNLVVYHHLWSIILLVLFARGLEAILVDYARPAVVGQALAKISIVSLYVLSVMTLGGLFYFTYSDVGLTNAIKMFWKI